MRKLCALAILISLCGGSFSQVTNTIIQPDGTQGKDAYVVSGSVGNTNYGSFDQAVIGFNQTGTGRGAVIYVYRGFFEFDVSSIPSNAIILNSTLSLYCKAGQNLSSGNTSLQVVESSWNEAQITYNNQPNATVSTQVNNSQATTNSWHTFDVTSHVQDMIVNSSTNFGWRLKLTTESNGGSAGTISKYYYTSDYSNATLRPKLEIQWVLPMEVNDAIITHASSSVSSDGGVEPNVINGDGNYTYKWINGASGTQISTNEVLTGVGPGWYGLEVTDGKGYKEYMAFIIGVECESYSFDFQPGANYIDDAFISNFQTSNGSFDASDSNYGLNTDFIITRDGGAVPPNNNSSLIKFKIWIDDGIAFSKSKLVLTSRQYSFSTTNRTEFTRITNDWGELTVTHNNQPSYDINDRIELPPVLTSGSGSPTVGIELKDFFNGWKLNPNYGLHYDLILSERYVSTYKYTGFFSADNTLSKTPKIEFTINISCEYARLSSKIEQGYFNVTRENLRISMIENYNDDNTNLEYKITDLDNDQVFTDANFSVNKSNNTNWLEINVGSSGLNLTSGHFYLLEIKNEKNQIEYLRFKIQ